MPTNRLAASRLILPFPRPACLAVACLTLATACTPPADTPPNDTAASQADHFVPSTPENLNWGWYPIDKEPVLRKGLSPAKALSLASIAVDFRVRGSLMPAGSGQ